VYLGLGDEYNARRLYGKAREAYRAAYRDCEQALELGLDDTTTYWYAAVALRAMDDFDTAVRTFEQALAALDGIEPSLVATLEGEKAETLRLWGKELDDAARLEEAIDTFDRALERAADGTEVAWMYDSKGSALVQLGRYPEALSSFDQVLQLDANNAWAHVKRGKAYGLLGHYQKARHSFERVLSLDCDHSGCDPWALVGLGWSFEHLGANEKAVRAYDLALSAPSGPEAYLDRSRVFRDYQIDERAESDLRKALELAIQAYEQAREKQDRLRLPDLVSTLAEAYNALAWFYADELPSQERLAEAISLAERAVELAEPGYSQGNYMDTLGWAYYRLGRYKEALNHLEKAVELVPHDMVIRVHLREAERAHQESAAGE
ncbi:MAG: tetratricopeptide repeat protein, partial [Anaerolineae bacterium]